MKSAIRLGIGLPSCRSVSRGMRVQTCDEKVDARAGENSSVSYETAAANADIGLLPTTSPRRAAVGLPGLNVPVSREGSANETGVRALT